MAPSDRIDAPAFPHRSSRVIALDPGAAAEVAGLARDRRWGGGRFLEFESAVPGDALLRRVPGTGGDGDGETALLGEELDGADTVVMVASAEGSPAAAAIIGDAAAARGIMPAGLVIGATAPSDPVVSALRPNAMVLVIMRETADLPEVLSALRV